MRKPRIIPIFILLFFLQASSTGYAQGFGEKILFNDQWSFHLGDIEYGGIEHLTPLPTIFYIFLTLKPRLVCSRCVVN